MKYISQLNAFMVQSMMNRLSANDRSLYYALLELGNIYHWPEWFFATNRDLMFRAGINSKCSFARAQNLLIQKGFIEVIKGSKKKKGQPAAATQYHIRVIYGAETGAHIRLDKTRGEENIAAAPARAHARENRPETDAGLGQVVRLFSDNIHPVTGEIELGKLTDLYDRYGKKWVTEAIREAVAHHGNSLSYITAILSRWERDGFKQTKGDRTYEQGGTEDGGTESVYARYLDSGGAAQESETC